MEIGKIFEKEFKESIPEHCYYLRLKDGTAAYGQNNDKVRFQAHNICDCIVFGNEYSYFIELKNCNVTSLPFTNIRETQLEEMSKVDHPKIKTYFVVCFRMKERCFIAEAKKIKEFKETTDRKSIPIVWFEENGIEIKMTRKIKRYKYDLEEVLK